MNVTWGTLVRLTVLVIAVVVLQIAVVAQIAVFDASADLLPLVALSIGLLAGPVAGATVGFLLGLVADMALLQTLGVSSLLLIGVGYLAGRFREMRDATHKLVPPIGGFLATLGFDAGFALVQFLLGVDSLGEPAGDPGGARQRGHQRPARDPGVRGRARAAALRPDRRPAAAAPAGHPHAGCSHRARWTTDVPVPRATSAW